MFDWFIAENNNFITWGFEHALAISFFVITGFLMIKSGKRQTDQNKKWVILHKFGWALSLTVMIWTLIQILAGKFDIKADLPILICNFMALTFPVFTKTKSKLLFEIIYFWILVATVQAIITPDLKNSFPHYHFIKFWMVHCGLVVALMYTIFVIGYRPRFYSIFKSFLALELFILIVFGINYLLDANYMYLNAKPDFPTALDALGDYPKYIFNAHLVVFPVFLLFYLPFGLEEWNNYKKKKA